MDRETWDKTHTSGSGDPDTEKERNFRESAQTGTGPYGNGEGFVSSESDGEARSGAEGDLRKGSAEGRADTGSAGGEAEVDYSIASGLREEVKSQRSTFAWNSKNSSENESTDGIQGSSFAGRTSSASSEFSSEGTYSAENSEAENGWKSDDFSRNTDTWTNHATQEEGADFFQGEGSSYQENPDFIRQQNGKRQKKQKKSVSSRTKKGIAVALAVILCFGAGIGGGVLGANLFGSKGGGSSTSNISIDSSESGMDAASVIAEKLMPSVVGISTVSTEYRQSIFGTQQGTVQSSGTGFIVDENGYILTNSHVVDNGNSSQITVDLYDGSEYPGTVLWSDSSLDLAIVKIDAKNLQAVELGDSDDVQIGDYAVAIGNPLGRDFERSVTQGIISGLDRTITTTDGESTNTMQGLLQTDASINSGNSGGPLINSSGEVIGINTAKASSAEGLGFAIPINTALPVIEEVKENGTYESVYLGITGMSVEDAMAQYQTDFKTEKGVAVLQIYTDSPASAAGMKEGDVITAIDGDAIENMSDLKKKLVNYRPGDKITVTIERSKTDMTLELTLQAQSQASAMQYKSSGTSGSSGSSGSDGYSGGQQDGSGTYGSDPYSDLFGGLFGN